LKKRLCLTEETMRKAGDLGFLSVAVPEAYGGMGMGFVNTVLVCDYTGSRVIPLPLDNTELEPCQSLYTVQKNKKQIRAQLWRMVCAVIH
jgi:alkylation response protein AidB-like acyl-CoA dehydrogenase